MRTAPAGAGAPTMLSGCDWRGDAVGGTYEENLERVVGQLRDFRSPGGLYGTSEKLLERFTYLPQRGDWQRRKLRANVRDALTLELFSVNPLPYHEMRRGLIIGLGEGQWKPTLGHVFPEILHRNGKLRMLASQNIDGLDHKVMSDKRKLYNPHGLMSTLVSEPREEPLCTNIDDPIYKRYVELVKANIKDIYADKRHREGRSSHLWPGPAESTPITLAMFGDLLPEELRRAAQQEAERGTYSVKPGSVLFDMRLWTTNAAGESYDAFRDVRSCDLMLVMGTSLSGLTIDGLAHSAGPLGKPRVVFDVTSAPVDSIRREGPWGGNDSLLQGPIDSSILQILDRMGWLAQLVDFLPVLCLTSLRTSRAYVAEKTADADLAETLGAIEQAIDAEVERERRFYFDE